MRKMHLALLLMLGIAASGMAQIYPQWAVRAGGTDYDYPGDSYTDAAGNTYVSGHFQASAWFGDIAISSAGNKDIFIAKLSPYGDWLWALSAGGPGMESCFGLAVDNEGYVYVGGDFSQTISFGNYTFTATGGSNSDLFVAKLSPDGEWVWAIAGGGTGYDSCTSIELDSSGDLRIAGCFTSPATFGPFTMTGPNGALGIIARVDPLGEWAWMQRAGTPYGAFVSDIVVGPEGNSYFTGYINSNNPNTFGDTTLQGVGSRDIVVGALDANGGWLWARSGGGAGSDSGSGIALYGNTLYVAGSAEGNFNIGTNPYTTSGGVDACVASISTSGIWGWAACCGGSGYDVGTGIDTDDTGKIVTCGLYSSGLFNCGTIVLDNAGGTDVFVARLNASGAWQDAAKGGGSGDENCYNVRADAEGNAYLVGYFTQPCTFGNTTISTNGGTDVYVAQFTGSALAVDMAALELNGSTAPNVNMPNSYHVIVQNRGLQPESNYQVKLANAVGMVLESVPGPALDAGETASVEIIWTPSELGTVFLIGRVELAGDLYPPNDATATLEVSMQQPGILAGYVRAMNNAPIAGATVTCTGPVTLSTTSSANGSYSMYLPSGLYGATASHSGYDPVTHATVNVATGLTTTLHFWLPTAAIDDPASPDAVSALLGCHPNPFRDAARIDYSAKVAGDACIAIYDMRGRKIAVLLEGELVAGTGSVQWDGRDGAGNRLPAGIYLCRMRMGGHVSNLKLVLAR